MTIALEDIQPLDQFVSENPQVWKNLTNARWAIHHREQNGLEEFGCITKRNNRIYVVKPRMVDWFLAGAKDEES